MSLTDGPVRLGGIEGFGAKNEIIFSAPKKLPLHGWVVFFGGDMQDYKENMLAHRDNQFYAEWDLETTSAIIQSRFPEHVSIIVKPSKMALKTFGCYENFVPSNNFGAPTYEDSTHCLKHLMHLLKNIEVVVKEKFSLGIEVNSTIDKTEDSGVLNEAAKTDSGVLDTHTIPVPLTLVGFSKGCVVLNQLLYSLHSLVQNPDSNLESFVKQIHSIYWLDGGHSGTSETWLSNKQVLDSFALYPIEVHVDVTPYQVKCDTRPRIGKEEKSFRETLTRLGMKLHRTIHFENEQRSLEKHFQVLNSF